ETDGFSPADIEFAARKASQSALENAIYRSGDSDAATGPTTADYLGAIAGTRATVSIEVASEFLQDIELLARL
ncbi:MAG: AAA family ATPase, partial [Microbacteriaceae bacterium]|nr:AAA family ATPase [Microbacteriaceae bacterium]